VCCFLVAKRIRDARISQTGARVFIPDDDRWLKDFAMSCGAWQLKAAAPWVMLRSCGERTGRRRTGDSAFLRDRLLEDPKNRDTASCKAQAGWPDNREPLARNRLQRKVFYSKAFLVALVFFAASR